MRKIFVGIFLFAASSSSAQQAAPSANFIRENAPVIAVTHVQLIDGTGAAAQTDQIIVIDHGKILAVGPATSTAVPAGAKVIDAKGKSAIPGLVGMHEHLFYPAANDGDPIFVEQPFSFPQLYLASGVTTPRTTGSIEPYSNLQVKARVDSGKLPGPDFYLACPYLEGAPSAFLQMYPLKDAGEARAFVDYWHSVGFASLKAYVDVKPDELRAGIEGAHRLAMKVMGHLCSVGYIEAAEMGIDDLEHGPYGAPDGELYSKKKPGVCGEGVESFGDYLRMLKEIVTGIEPDGPELRKATDSHVAHHVAITSTLAVFKGATRPPMNLLMVKRWHELMSPQAWSHAMTERAEEMPAEQLFQTLLKKEMKFGHNFVTAGGHVGHDAADPMRSAQKRRAVLRGDVNRFDRREAGLADLVLLDGDLVKDITVIEKPEIVFKNGIGYDSNAIYDSLRGQVGLQ
jgi:hypothetical protein